MRITSFASCCLLFSVTSVYAVGNAAPAHEKFNPLQQVKSKFPGSVEYRSKDRVLEFCPDNTCDGFKAANEASLGDLRDFAYLYIYFFSDYYVLEDWRGDAASKETADRVLSRSQYQNCKRESDLESAKCVLGTLSRNGRIELLFVRYDENKRNVVHKDIAKQLSKLPSSKPHD